VCEISAKQGAHGTSGGVVGRNVDPPVAPCLAGARAHEILDSKFSSQNQFSMRAQIAEFLSGKFAKNVNPVEALFLLVRHAWSTRLF